MESYRGLVESFGESAIRLKAGLRTAAFDTLYQSCTKTVETTRCVAVLFTDAREYNRRVQFTDANRLYAALAVVLTVVAIVTYLTSIGLVDRVLRFFEG